MSAQAGAQVTIAERQDLIESLPIVLERVATRKGPVQEQIEPRRVFVLQQDFQLASSRRHH